MRSVSTKVTDSNGGAYKHLRDIQVIRVLDYTRLAVKAEVDTHFAQVKLAAVAHTATATDPGKIRAVIINTLKALEASTTSRTWTTTSTPSSSSSTPTIRRGWMPSSPATWSAASTSKPSASTCSEVTHG